MEKRRERRKRKFGAGGDEKNVECSEKETQ
jgi:hypothetical protein